MQVAAIHIAHTDATLVAAYHHTDAMQIVATHILLLLPEPIMEDINAMQIAVIHQGWVDVASCCYPSYYPSYSSRCYASCCYTPRTY